MGYKTDFEKIISLWEKPVLIVSSLVGRGNFSIAEAIREKFADQKEVYHMPVEHMLPASAIHEDLERYKIISNHFRFLLHLIYRIPIFYYRKLFREKVFRPTDLRSMDSVLKQRGIKTVVCVSHRPAFWLSVLKTRERSDFKLWGVLAEFGKNLGWQYICWEAMDGFLSPLARKSLRIRFHPRTQFILTDPQCRNIFYRLTETKGDKNKVLFVAGYWGQISFSKVLSLLFSLLKELPQLNIYVVCGSNGNLFKKLKNKFSSSLNINIYGAVDNLFDLMRQCASVITKPGFSTLVESNSAGRKIFLLKGMPVAEDNNARYALMNFSAQWFNIRAFKSWYFAQ